MQGIFEKLYNLKLSIKGKLKLWKKCVFLTDFLTFSEVLDIIEYKIFTMYLLHSWKKH